MCYSNQPQVLSYEEFVGVESFQIRRKTRIISSENVKYNPISSAMKSVPFMLEGFHLLKNKWRTDRQMRKGKNLILLYSSTFLFSGWLAGWLLSCLSAWWSNLCLLLPQLKQKLETERLSDCLSVRPSVCVYVYECLSVEGKRNMVEIVPKSLLSWPFNGMRLISCCSCPSNTLLQFLG